MLARTLAGCFVIAIASAGSVRAEQADPLFRALHDANAARKPRQGPIVGFHDPRCAFSEIPPASILVGFDCGVGTFIDFETIYALRAIYRTQSGVLFGPEHGAFADRRLGLDAGARTRVLHTARLQAPPGYAVAGVTIRSGLHIHGMALTYQKLDGLRVAPGQTLQSEWVGDRGNGTEALLGGDGALVVGIHGSANDTQIHALGLVTLEPTPTPLPKEPRPEDPPALRPPDPARLPPVMILGPAAVGVIAVSLTWLAGSRRST